MNASLIIADPQIAYIHNPTVPDKENLQLGGTSSTSLFSGANIYSYSIQVPPGTNGLSPKISLMYNSHTTSNRPSIIGTGWSISENYIQRDVNHTRDSLDNDEFILFLDGAKYDLVYVSSENRFHTEIESYLFIENLTGGDNQKDMYWKVKARDGQQYRFGYLSTSEQVSNQNNNMVSRWYLDLINDTHNNSIFFSYNENPYNNDEGATYIQNITYNNDRLKVIRFHYEKSDRSDLWTVHDFGNKVTESRRISNIEVFANGSLIRRHSLSYQSSGLNTRRSIANITEYGTDNTSALPSTTFTHQSITKGWTTNSNWECPVSFTSTTGIDYGTRLVDVNADGMVDIIRGYKRDSGTTLIGYINNGDGWTQDNDWAPPSAFSDENGVDFGLRLADVNGDGLVDIIKGYKKDSGTTLLGYTNTGDGWTQDNDWAPPSAFSHEDGVDFGLRLADVNGDGLVDIIKGYKKDSGTTLLGYINNGDGWTQDNDWAPPSAFSDEDGFDLGLRLADVNGDGLVDIIKGYEKDSGTTLLGYINNGDGWTQDNDWAPPSAFSDEDGFDLGLRLADVNGDGLVDIIKGYEKDSGTTLLGYINNGDGWTQDNDWAPPRPFSSDDGINYGLKLTDVNGDGLLDLVRSYLYGAGHSKFTYLNNGKQNFLMIGFNNTLGGSTIFSYLNSTDLDNTGDDSDSDLGFNIWLVRNIESENGMVGSQKVVSETTFNYSGGAYDYLNREFRGFNHVIKTRPDNSTEKYWFHQNNSLKGRIYKQSIDDKNDNTYQKIEYQWTDDFQNNYYEIQLFSRSEYQVDGDSTGQKITNITFTYDNFGNVNKTSFMGDISTSGDEFYNYTIYVNNSNAWIVNKPKITYILDSDDSTKLKENKFYYDGSSYGTAPTKGDLTKVEYWHSTDTNPEIEYGYDSYGNIINITDPLDYVTVIEYESTHTFPIKTTNPSEHIIEYTYDLGTGNLLTMIDENSQIHNYSYDLFGRIDNETHPYDSDTYPSIEYEYSFDGTAPEKVTVKKREQYGQAPTYDSLSFYDGYGRLIQSKSEGENEQIVLNVFYDGMGNVIGLSNPYFVSSSSSYSTPSTTVNHTYYSYDALQRQVNITNPDGTTKLINHFHWNVTRTDENANQKSQLMDAYGRIVQVQEHTSDGTYNTYYAYDSLGNLLNISDNNDNVIEYTYDTLGRITSVDDPDTGLTNYSYDANGNLISQISGGGNLVTGDGHYREYNEFGQLVKIRDGNNASSSLLEEYWYDHDGQRIKTKRYDSANTYIYTPFKEFMMIKNDSGTYNYTYIYDGSTLVARLNPDRSKWFYHPDHLGSTTLITDEDGNLVEESSYYPYGAEFSGGDSEIRGYEGKELDSTGQQYYGARYYDPGKRLWIQPDPIMDIYNPQNLNRYSFELNNPYKYTDPDGRIVCGGVCVTGAVMLIGASVYGSTYSAGMAGVEYLDQLTTVHSEQDVTWSEARQIILNDPQMTAQRQDAAKVGAIIGGVQGGLQGLVQNLNMGGNNIKSKNIEISSKQLQKKFKHASDFGIRGNYNKQTSQSFKNAISDHIDSPDTNQISGTYRNTIQGTHHFNPNNNNWVFVDKNNKYISGWKLSNTQTKELLENSNIK